MKADLTPEEVELNVVWLERFGEPLPMTGCPDLVRNVLGLSIPMPEEEAPLAA
jgi:hypothetical protein